MDEVNKYIDSFPEATKQRLLQVRQIVKSVQPQLVEGMKWGKLAYSGGTIMVILAGYKQHIDLHVTKTTVDAFKDKLKDYQTTSGSVQLPLNKPIPTDLIKQILKYRLDEYRQHKILWR